MTKTLRETEHIDLGLVPETDKIGFTWPMQLTTASLTFYAKHCLQTQTIVTGFACPWCYYHNVISLPVVPIDIVPANSLRNLGIAQLTTSAIGNRDLLYTTYFLF